MYDLQRMAFREKKVLLIPFFNGICDKQSLDVAHIKI